MFFWSYNDYLLINIKNFFISYQKISFIWIIYFWKTKSKFFYFPRQPNSIRNSRLNNSKIGCVINSQLILFRTSWMEESQGQNNISEHYSNQNESRDLVSKMIVSLTVGQANAINTILPKSYSLQIEPEIKAKKNNNKKKSIGHNK